MFHKPRGCITARRDARHATVMDYFPEERRDELFPVGRLDKDTEGFLLVTDDGDLCFELMSPENEIPKTYFFWALGTLREEKIKEIESGISIYKGRDFETAPAKIHISHTATLADIKPLLSDEDAKMSRKRGEMQVTAAYITITEGKYHQIKQMLYAVYGYTSFRHRFQKTGLCLWGSTIDFIRKDDLTHDGAFFILKFLCIQVENRYPNHI